MLNFKENYIEQLLNGNEKNWSVSELLTCYEPMSGEPLAVRMLAMQQVMNLAKAMYNELSEDALLRYHFWKQLRPIRIEERKYEYSVTVSKTYRWELTVNSEGLFYKDLTPMYSQIPGQIHEQLFSDFWFFGPKMPIPDLKTRQWVVAQIRNSFLQIGPVSQKHFQLFEYPKLPIDRFWEEGDHKSSDFVNLRHFGIEYGCTNWHDGLVYLGFISFERFLADPVVLERIISPDIRAELLEHLSVKDQVPQREEEDPQKAKMKKIFMENGGMHHHIHREHGDSYSASPIDEFIWRRELLDELTQRLKMIDHYSGLNYIATVLRYHSVPELEALFVAAARTSNLKARQAIGQVMSEHFNSEAAAQVTLSLLEYEDESDYWRNYVFNALGRMRNNRAVQRFVIQCLKGDNETHFKKAVEVIQLWGMKGDNALMDRDLWLSLNWQDACAADPNFTRGLEKVIKIIGA